MADVVLNDEQRRQLDGYIKRLKQIEGSTAPKADFGDIPRIVGGGLCVNEIDNGAKLKEELRHTIAELERVRDASGSVRAQGRFPNPGVATGACSS